MSVREALMTIGLEWGNGFATSDSLRLAPIIERALRAAYKQAADDYNVTAPEGCLAVCTSTDNGVTAGVAAMMEES